MWTRVPGCVAALTLPLVLVVSTGCTAGPEDELASLLQQTGERKPELDHRGPDVYFDETGPARYVEALWEGFRSERAMENVRFADRFYRAPASPGYDLVIDRLIEILKESGYGGWDMRLELDVYEEPRETPAWEPKNARLVLMASGSEPRELHAFSPGNDRDRTMLPINAPACDVEGEVALSLSDLEEGMILVTEASLTQVLERARSKGAAAVVSSSLSLFNVDPSGRERQLDAIQFRSVAAGTAVPVCQISPRSFETIVRAAEAGGARIALQADVAFEDRPLRTLVATVVGSMHPDEAVASSSHVQEPGACDNASGLAGLLESARSLAELLQAGRIPWPKRSLVFIWGDEYRQTEVWLENTQRTPVAGISSDMTGQSKDTGAIALLERHPDPGAVTVLPPDEHTPWGAGEVEDDWLVPNGLAVIARCAMADVSIRAGGWSTADHPWEGGSDHDVYLEQGVPAVLFWHFTDFTYHTSLDRVEFVDPEEMRRTGVAILATALAVAHPQPEDLDRYVRSLHREEAVRVAAAEEVSLSEAAAAWRQWCHGARMWLRILCLGPEAEIPLR